METRDLELASNPLDDCISDKVIDQNDQNDTSSNSDYSSLNHLRSLTQRCRAVFHKKLVAGFNPQFFASVMGTGISANIMYKFPFPARWLEICGLIVATAALVLFLLLTLIFVVALYQDPKLWTKIHRDVSHAPAMGCFVMGFVTLVNMLHSITGKLWIYAVWVLWWIAVAGSFYTSFLTFYLSLISKHRKRHNYTAASTISMAYLLPVVTLTVAASVGGALNPDLPRVNMKIITMVVSFIMWAIAVVLAFIVVAVNFWRLFVYKVPATGQVFTMFLPIGFLGQGAYAILLFGQNCVEIILDHTSTVSTSSYTSFLHEAASARNVDLSGFPLILSTALLTTSTMFAASLMAVGYLFTFLAFASLLSKMQPFANKPDPRHIYAVTNGNFIQRALTGFLRFNRGFWSMTFPLGTMALCNGQIYKLYNGLEAFRYISAIYSVVLFVITLGCLSGVIYNSIKVVWWSMKTPSSDHKETV